MVVYLQKVKHVWGIYFSQEWKISQKLRMNATANEVEMATM